MTKEFEYMKEGLSTDLADFLMNDYSLSIVKALDTLYDSDTYSKICEPASGLFYQGSRYVYSYLQQELRDGRP